MRSNGYALSLVNLGQGTVVLDLPPESLLPKDTARVSAPAVPWTENCQLIDGVVKTRMGYTTLYTKASSNPVIGAFLCHFDDGVVEAIRADTTNVYYDAGSQWTSILGSQTGTKYDTWAFAMVRRTGTNSPINLSCVME